MSQPSGYRVSKIISVLVFISLTHYSEEVDTRCVSWLVGYTVISWSHLILATAHPKPIYLLSNFTFLLNFDYYTSARLPVRQILPYYLCS